MRGRTLSVLLDRNVICIMEPNALYKVCAQLVHVKEEREKKVI